MKKLHALIVDDEILVATLLRNSIDWSEHDIEFPTIATNVDEALAILQEKDYDIVFTDIHMPIINGLIFAREVARLYPAIQIVIVTGYDEFEYAKESVSIGVLEYIQKPIQPTEIRSVVIRAREEILNSRKTIQEYAKLRDQLFSNMEYLRERVLNQLILGDIPTTELSEQLNRYEIYPMQQEFSVAIIDLIKNDSTDTSIRLLVSQSAIKLLKKHFESPNERYAFLDNRQRIVLLAFSKQFDFYEYAQQLKVYLTNQIPCEIHVGIGNAYNWNDTYYKSYQEANSVLQVLQSESDSAISEARSLWDSNIAISVDYTNEISQLLSLMRAGLKSKVIEQLEAIKNTIISQHQEVAVTKALTISILSGITQSIVMVGSSGPNAFAEQYIELGKIYRSEESLEVFEILCAYVLQVTSYMGSKHQQTESQSINDIKHYLATEASSNTLSLSNVAQKFNYNQSYLSRLFKKEIGMTFSDYLMSLRMEKAAKLIRKSDLRAYQIAQRVGFIDSNYFSTCFKKYSGMTVSQYRADHR